MKFVKAHAYGNDFLYIEEHAVAGASLAALTREICDRHGILLVVDEVQSGVGRTGKWWAVEHTGVHPDIVCSAKGIASGMPLGVTISKAEIMDWVPGSHASTFGGNPVCNAAAMATFDVIERTTGTQPVGILRSRPSSVMASRTLAMGCGTRG